MDVANGPVVAANVAPHVRAAVIVVSPFALQSPVKPRNWKPDSASTCSVTAVPSGTLAEQSEPRAPHAMSTPMTLPPVGFVIVSGHDTAAVVGAASKVAPQVRACVIVRRPEGAQSPVNPEKTNPSSASARSSIGSPVSREDEQAEPRVPH